MSSIKHIRTFIMVADLKSFTNAAEALFMTQPAVSCQIKSLEENLGIPLIERNDKRIELTDAGKVFYREAKEIMVVYRRAWEVMDEFKGLKRGNLALGASTIPGEYVMPRYIGAFLRKYPGITMSLTVQDTGSVLDLLLDRKIDLGLVGAQVELDTVEFKPFLRDELVLIASASSDLPETITSRELPRLEFIARERNSGTRMVLKKIFASHGIAEHDLDITMELGSTQAVITAVGANLGVGFVSKWAVETAIKAGIVKKIIISDMNLERDLYIVTLKNAHYTRARDVFLEFLTSDDME